MQSKLTITALIHTASLSLNYTKTYLGLVKKMLCVANETGKGQKKF